jgi:hypothetical protein
LAHFQPPFLAPNFPNHGNRWPSRRHRQIYSPENWHCKERKMGLKKQLSKKNFIEKIEKKKIIYLVPKLKN